MKIINIFVALLIVVSASLWAADKITSTSRDSMSNLQAEKFKNLQLNRENIILRQALKTKCEDLAIQKTQLINENKLLRKTINSVLEKNYRELVQDEKDKIEMHENSIKEILNRKPSGEKL